jgi:hypothetical protein
MAEDERHVAILSAMIFTALFFILAMGVFEGEASGQPRVKRESFPAVFVPSSLIWPEVSAAWSSECAPK